MNKNNLKLSDGTAGGKSLMGTTKKINHDDKFIMDLSLNIKKKVYTAASTAMNSEDVSLIALGFSKELFNFTYKPTDNETLVLDGLVFFIINDTLTEKGYLVYRYFKQSTAINRKYILSLFPINDKAKDMDDRFCELKSIENLEKIRFTVDYVKDFNLLAQVQFKDADYWDNCMDIPNIMRYLSSDNAFFSLKVSSGKNTAFDVALYNMQLREKKHSLDIKEDLQISHALVGEIFDKVRTFTETFSTDKAALGEIMSSMDQVEHYSSFLKIFSKDLNNGTKIMQENMMEYVNRNNFLTLEDFPHLQKIKEKIDYIEKKQNVIYSRFREITNMINNKNVFKQLNRRFKGVDKVMNNLLTTINSEDFTNLSSKTEKLLNFMKTVDLKKLLKKARKIVKNEEKNYYLNAGNYGMASIMAICLLLLLVSCGIIKKINTAEKEHIL